jgi:hypothetical protein
VAGLARLAAGLLRAATAVATMERASRSSAVDCGLVGVECAFTVNGLALGWGCASRVRSTCAVPRASRERWGDCLHRTVLSSPKRSSGVEAGGFRVYRVSELLAGAGRGGFLALGRRRLDRCSGTRTRRLYTTRRGA